MSVAEHASAQTSSKSEITKISSAVDSVRIKFPEEKLYLHFDKPNYAIGDTIWFKAYLFDAAFLQPSPKSGICYIELLNDSDRLIKRMMLPIANGRSWGDIELNPLDFSEGNYTLHAYTNWMRNFGAKRVFKRQFYIASARENKWLVNYHIDLKNDSGVKNTHISLQFNKLDKLPLILKEMQMKVMDGSKLLYRTNTQTKIDGSLDLQFRYKGLSKNLTLIAEGLPTDGDHQKVQIPIKLSGDEDIDLQFMPEGGNLVAGLPAHVGFKAVAENGMGAEVKGVIYNKAHQQVATFNTVHQGMGAFDLIPQSDESYEAAITFPDGSSKLYSLPPVNSAGTVLKIRDIPENDSLSITVMATPGIQKLNDNYYLVGQSRGIVCYISTIGFSSDAVKIKIPKSIFPSGITRFTLMSHFEQPLNERVIFIDHHDGLQISITPDKSSYLKRDSIGLNLHVTDKNGNPIRGYFSLAATDDGAVKPDSIKTSNINSYLLMTSDLKGNIEDPGYYFQTDTGNTISRDMDNLLLTQGWIGYDWRDIFTPGKKPAFDAEKEFIVSGKVSNIFNKGIPKGNIVIFSKKPQMIRDTITDKNGRFIFRNILPIDTPAFMLQARNRNGNSFNVEIEVDEIKPPVFTALNVKSVPWYVSSDTTMLRYVKANINYRKAQEFQTKGARALKEVKITAKKIIKDSQNLNGPGNADQVIGEIELEKANKKTWLQLLQEKIPGFREGSVFIHSTQIERYFIKDAEMQLVIDGKWKYYSYTQEGFFEFRNYLRSHIAEDIKGIEVMSSYEFNIKYVLYYELGPFCTIVEITTRSGKGPDIHYTPGTYLYKPIPYSIPKQFYRPRYAVGTATSNTDLRSTLHWGPNIITDKNGNASVSFYSSDQSGTYTVTLEGCDMNGNIGSKRQKIKVAGK
ncbi:MAG: carboxypeptidase-like regulatory domain-containing protein [Mucilaginibacter sp.]